MRDTANAHKVYGDVAKGTEQPWPEHPGSAGRIDDSGLASYTVDFWEEKFFIRVTIEEKSSASLSVAQTFCFNISVAIRE